MNVIESLEDLHKRISDEPMVLLYLSRLDCSVCTALKPKVIEQLQEFPNITSYYVDLDQLPVAAGEYSVFSIPAILVYVDGKESVREARYIAVDRMFNRIDRLYGLRFS